MVLGLLNANLFIQLPSYHGSGAAGCRFFVKAEPCLPNESKGLHHNTRFRICHRSSPCKKGFFVLGFSVAFFGGVLVVLECSFRGSLFLILVVLECSFRGSLFFNPCGGSWDEPSGGYERCVCGINVCACACACPVAFPPCRYGHAASVESGGAVA